MANLEERPSIFVTGGKDERSFSGCSYYFTNSLKRQFSKAEIVCIPTDLYNTMRLDALLWALRFRSDPRPYFYLTKEYQEVNWKRVGKKLNKKDFYISFSPIIPKTVAESECHVILMVDMTLSQYLKYEHFGVIPKNILEELNQTERRSYSRADKIFAATDETLKQFINIYNISESTIEVIGRGINLPSELPLRHSKQERSKDALHVGFVGHDFKRKGLLILIEAIESTPELRKRVVVHAIGPNENDLKARPWLRLHGYMSKNEKLKRYIEILENSDIGYLFSQSEGIPGSILEFLSLGIPCLISDIPEMKVVQDLSGVITIPLSTGVSGVINKLLELINSLDKLEYLKKEASKNRFQGWERQAEHVASWCEQKLIDRN